MCKFQLRIGLAVFGFPPFGPWPKHHFWGPEPAKGASGAAALALRRPWQGPSGCRYAHLADMRAMVHKAGAPNNTGALAWLYFRYFPGYARRQRDSPAKHHRERGIPAPAPPTRHTRTKYSRVLTITGQPISHLGRTYLYLLSTTIWYGLQNSGLALKGVPSSNQCCPIYMQFKFEIQWESQGDLILRHSYNTYRWSPPSLVPKLSPVFSHRCVVRWVSHFAIFVRTRECMNDDGKLGEAS